MRLGLPHHTIALEILHIHLYVTKEEQKLIGKKTLYTLDETYNVIYGIDKAMYYELATLFQQGLRYVKVSIDEPKNISRFDRGVISECQQ